MSDFEDLDFAIHRSRRYHEKLAAFFAAWRDRMRVVTAVAGSAAFFVVVGKYQHAAEVLTAFIGLWAILDIIIMPDKKHDAHNALSKQFTALAAKIESSPKTEGALRDLKTERLLIEVNEPPCKRLVDIEARNDECRAREFPPERQAPLTRFQKWVGYYGWDWDLHRLEQWKAEQGRH
ncbi:MAG TPA: hypothetical protein VIQ05_16030 [Tardiphaga sp.]